MLALSEETLPVAVLLLAILLIPLIAAGGFVHQTTDLDSIETLSTTGNG